MGGSPQVPRGNSLACALEMSVKSRISRSHCAVVSNRRHRSWPETAIYDLIPDGVGQATQCQEHRAGSPDCLSLAGTVWKLLGVTVSGVEVAVGTSANMDSCAYCHPHVAPDLDVCRSISEK